MIAAYGSAAGEVRVFDRISCEEFCEVDDDDPADTFWNYVEDAEDYLARNRDEVFGDLKDELLGSPAPVVSYYYRCEERRVGTAWSIQCRYGWVANQLKK